MDLRKKFKLENCQRGKKPVEDKDSGITPLDIAGLPAEQKQIMFWMLRDKIASSIGVSFDVLQNQFSDIDSETLDEILEALTDDQWLVMDGKPPNELYKLNLRRKKGRLSSDIWSALE